MQLWDGSLVANLQLGDRSLGSELHLVDTH